MPPPGESRSCRVVGVIPARWESARFPGKMLANLGGKPLIVRTFQTALRAGTLDDVFVATDNEHIRDAIQAEGGRAIMTDPALPTGSDRVLAALKDEPADIVVNIQGDEPLLPPYVVDRTVQLLLDHPEFGVTTAAAPLKRSRRNDPNAVKVVLDSNNRALYFSRSLIPYPKTENPAVHLFYRHIGLYAYRREVLEEFCARQPAELELCEKLEQLRLLYHGVSIGVVEVETVPPGVDTREELKRVRRLFEQ